MYQYPYGNAQQLNLDWILGKIQELEAGASEVNIEEVANTLIAASFDAGVSYRRYDYCFYNGKLYRALNDTSGAFNPADWLEVVIGDDIPVLTRLLNAVDTSLTSLQTTVGNQGNAITNLQNALGDLDSDDVDNASNVTGDSVSDALDNLNTAVTTIAPLDSVPTNGSTKGITSDGVYDALNNVVLSNAITLTFAGVTTTAIINKKNGIINFNLNLGDGTSFTSATGYDTIGTVPDGFRPMTDMSFIGMARTTGIWASATYVPIYLVISATTGEITIRANASEIQTCKYIYCSFLWI